MYIDHHTFVTPSFLSLDAAEDSRAMAVSRGELVSIVYFSRDDQRWAYDRYDIPMRTWYIESTDEFRAEIRELLESPRLTLKSRTDLERGLTDYRAGDTFTAELSYS